MMMPAERSKSGRSGSARLARSTTLPASTSRCTSSSCSARRSRASSVRSSSSAMRSARICSGASNVARHARLQHLTELRVLVAAEEVQGAVLVGAQQPALVERLDVDVDGDDEADAQLVVAEHDGVLQLALDPRGAVLQQRRVDVGGGEDLELGRLELVDVLAGVAAEVLDMVKQGAGGNVDRELLGAADHVEAVARLLERDADEGRLERERHVPGHGQHVALALVARGDEGDGAAHEDACGGGDGAALNAVRRLLDHVASIRRAGSRGRQSGGARDALRFEGGAQLLDIELLRRPLDLDTHDVLVRVQVERRCRRTTRTTRGWGDPRTRCTSCRSRGRG